MSPETGSNTNKVGIKMATDRSQSPAVVLRERRGKTAGWTTKQRRSDKSTTELCHRKKNTEKRNSGCLLA